MRHYEAKIKDLEVEIFQQRNLNKALEKMLRELIKKFKAQKNRIKDELAETSDAKDGLTAYVADTERELAETLEKKVLYKEKAKRHKKKNLRYSDKYVTCEKHLIETQADYEFMEESLSIIIGENIFLQDRLFYSYMYLQYCVVGWKYRFKQWWTGIYHIDKLREKL